MADAAVARAKPIMLVAALQSTLAPSLALLQSSANAANAGAPMRINNLPLEISTLLVADAWHHFLAGDHSAYLNTIVKSVIENNLDKQRTIVLAQASMHGAVPLLMAHGITALSSPELGVRHALTLLGTCMTGQLPITNTAKISS